MFRNGRLPRHHECIAALSVSQAEAGLPNRPPADVRAQTRAWLGAALRARKAQVARKAHWARSVPKGCSRPYVFALERRQAPEHRDMLHIERGVGCTRAATGEHVEKPSDFRPRGAVHGRRLSPTCARSRLVVLESTWQF